jgi:hypothetical protein
VAQERRTKVVYVVLGVLAVLLLAASVLAVVAAGGESLRGVWILLFLAPMFGLVLVLTTIGEVLASEASKMPVAFKHWHWLLVMLGNGALLGFGVALADNDWGFWEAFWRGFVFGVLVANFWVLMATIPPAVRRFVKPSK